MYNKLKIPRANFPGGLEEWGVTAQWKILLLKLSLKRKKILLLIDFPFYFFKIIFNSYPYTTIYVCYKNVFLKYLYITKILITFVYMYITKTKQKQYIIAKFVLEQWI